MSAPKHQTRAVRRVTTPSRLLLDRAERQWSRRLSVEFTWKAKLPAVWRRGVTSGR
jgi:hypothetical protein